MNVLKSLLIFLFVMTSFSSLPAQPARSYALIGHRGAAADAPENTLISIRRALDLGVDRIEIDVHLTSDRQVVLMHDRTLNRTTNGSGEVRRHSLADIRQLDAGRWFNPSFEGEKVPTLEEVLELIDGKCQLMIEVKEHGGYDPGIEEAVAQVIRKYKAHAWCVVISMRHRVVADFHRLVPDIRLHRSYVGKIPLLPLYLGTSLGVRGPRSYPYVEEFNLNGGFISRCFMKKAERLNKKVNAWTIDHPEHAEKLLKKGVHGIITNCPVAYGQ